MVQLLTRFTRFASASVSPPENTGQGEDANTDFLFFGDQRDEKKDPINAGGGIKRPPFLLPAPYAPALGGPAFWGAYCRAISCGAMRDLSKSEVWGESWKRYFQTINWIN